MSPDAFTIVVSWQNVPLQGGGGSKEAEGFRQLDGYRQLHCPETTAYAPTVAFPFKLNVLELNIGTTIRTIADALTST